ncbi:hybrid sensor histidine kinase/response regulator [Sesbania bispinosa]|nr:hybrid sensor histidine kinase/response regulator [Sesbania bispinosa]
MSGRKIIGALFHNKEWMQDLLKRDDKEEEEDRIVNSLIPRGISICQHPKPEHILTSIFFVLSGHVIKILMNINRCSRC